MRSTSMFFSGGSALACALGMAVASAPAAAADTGPLAGMQYEPGGGLRLPALDLTFAGYMAMRAHNLQQADARLDLRDVSLFVIWQPSSRWQLFSEIEAEHLLVVDDRGATTGDIEVDVERVYVDFTAAANLTLRAGRYLTPFGRWNQIHAEPLVWTTTRPLVTQLAIPDHGSGAAVLGSFALGDDSVDYTVYADDGADLDPVNGEADFEDVVVRGLSNDFRHAGGAQIRYHLLDDRAELAASVATFDMTRHRGRMTAAGLDGLLRWRRLELSAEFAFRDNGSHYTDDDVGGYAQAALRLVGQLHGIARAEHYHSGLLDRDASRATLGLSWRPLPPLNLKIEYSAGDDPQLVPDGVQMSISTLF